MFVCTHTHESKLVGSEQKPKKGSVFLEIENECKRHEWALLIRNRNTYFKKLPKNKDEKRERERELQRIRDDGANK